MATDTNEQKGSRHNMSSTMTSGVVVTVTFMSAGPAMSLTLPPSYSPLPQSRGIVDYGNGGRDCIFVPTALDAGMDSTFFPDVSQIDGVDGRLIEVHKSLDPVSWVLRWVLGSGVFYTHVKGYEGYDTVQLVAQKLHIAELNGGLVSVVPDPPLVRAPNATSREWLMFLKMQTSASSDRPTGGLMFFRPSVLGDGVQALVDLGQGFTEGRVGTPSGVEVALTDSMAQSDLQSALNGIYSSFVVH